MRKIIILIGVLGAATTVSAQELGGPVNAWWIFGGLVLLVAVGGGLWAIVAGQTRTTRRQMTDEEFKRILDNMPDLSDSQRQEMIDRSSGKALPTQQRPSRPAASKKPAKETNGEKSLAELQAELNKLQEELTRLQEEPLADGIVKDVKPEEMATRARELTEEVQRRSAQRFPSEATGAVITSTPPTRQPAKKKEDKQLEMAKKLRDEARRRRTQEHPAVEEKPGRSEGASRQTTPSTSTAPQPKSTDQSEIVSTEQPADPTADNTPIDAPQPNEAIESLLDDYYKSITPDEKDKSKPRKPAQEASEPIPEPQAEPEPQPEAPPLSKPKPAKKTEESKTTGAPAIEDSDDDHEVFDLELFPDFDEKIIQTSEVSKLDLSGETDSTFDDEPATEDTPVATPEPIVKEEVIAGDIVTIEESPEEPAAPAPPAAEKGTGATADETTEEDLFFSDIFDEHAFLDAEPETDEPSSPFLDAMVSEEASTEEKENKDAAEETLSFGDAGGAAPAYGETQGGDRASSNEAALVDAPTSGSTPPPAPPAAPAPAAPPSRAPRQPSAPSATPAAEAEPEPVLKRQPEPTPTDPNAPIILKNEDEITVVNWIVGRIRETDWQGESETNLQETVDAYLKVDSMGKSPRFAAKKDTKEMLIGGLARMPYDDASRQRVFEAVKARLTNIRTAEFTAFYPRKTPADKRSGVFVYVQATEEEIRQQVQMDVSKYKEELGGEVPEPKTAKQTADLPLGTQITIVPECDDVEFEPPSLSKRWRGQWTRYGFDFWPHEDLVDETLFVRISVQVQGIEIAHIKAAIEVIAADEKATAKPITTQIMDINPLLRHKLTAQQITPYQRIFISYSRRDSDVARSYKIAQQALGNDCFLDVDNLRSGEDWQAGLARAIDEADVFQLFWSNHSAASKYCRYEWEYALDQRCSDVTCDGFIRPVYWQKPMPRVPDKLRSVNFKFVPFPDENDKPSA